MPKEYSRSQRMAEQVRREVAEIARDDIKDPRMGFLSFTEVRMSRDLSHAVIYCSVFDSEQQNETIELLNRAVGVFRKELARRIRARIVPTLKFVADESLSRGAEMDNLISKAIHSDAENSHYSEGASADEDRDDENNSDKEIK